MSHCLFPSIPEYGTSFVRTVTWQNPSNEPPKNTDVDAISKLVDSYGVVNDLHRRKD